MTKKNMKTKERKEKLNYEYKIFYLIICYFNYGIVVM